jgi:hypothetical protein
MSKSRWRVISATTAWQRSRWFWTKSVLHAARALLGQRARLVHALRAPGGVEEMQQRRHAVDPAVEGDNESGRVPVAAETLSVMRTDKPRRTRTRSTGPSGSARAKMPSAIRALRSVPRFPRSSEISGFHGRGEEKVQEDLLNRPDEISRVTARER